MGRAGRQEAEVEGRQNCVDRNLNLGGAQDNCSLRGLRSEGGRRRTGGGRLCIWCSRKVMGMYEPQYTLPSSKPSLGANYRAATHCWPQGREVSGERSRGEDSPQQEILQSDFRNDFLSVSRPWGSGEGDWGKARISYLSFSSKPFGHQVEQEMGLNARQ